MRYRIAVSLVGLLTALCAAPMGSAAAATTLPAGTAAACASAPAGYARCFTLVRTDHAAAASTAVPVGYGPADLQSAYRLPTDLGAGQLIAIVDAYDDPSAEADLATYRATYGLPPCTTDNGCFRKVNEAGVESGYPAVDGGWAVEISLDLDMVSAACPRCDILLVEANTAAVPEMASSVDTAVALGADVVSNSYGLSEGNGMQQFYGDYSHPGHVIVASSGDFGFMTAQFPAVAPGVLAVGGTSLTPANNRRGWSETVWGHGVYSGSLGGAGSGCSAYVSKPAWQQDRYCHMRTVADVAADADPQTGPAVYDSTPNPRGTAGWLVVGGTSASAPFVAGVIGLAGNAATFTPGYAYAHAGSLFDVTDGSNGYCGKDYLCTGKPGYDGPTGLGSPDGTGAL